MSRNVLFVTGPGWLVSRLGLLVINMSGRQQALDRGRVIDVVALERFRRGA